MLSPIAVVAAILALTSLAWSSPILVRDYAYRDFDGGNHLGLAGAEYGTGLAFDHGGLFGGDSFRFAIDRARFDGDEGLVAADRDRHFDLDRDQALDAEAYFATNFDVDKLQGIDESDFLKAIELSGDGTSRRNIGIGHSGLWRRQLDDEAQGADDGGDFDITFDDDDVGSTAGGPASADADSMSSEPGVSPEEATPQDVDESSTGVANETERPDEDASYPSTPADFTPDTSLYEEYQPNADSPSPFAGNNLDAPSSATSVSTDAPESNPAAPVNDATTAEDAPETLTASKSLPEEQPSNHVDASP
ncbi:hypothetical protein JCM11491_006214 [Sporobolomyces phaffii]